LLREKNTVALLEEKVKKLQTLLKEEKQRFSVSVETLKSEITKYFFIKAKHIKMILCTLQDDFLVCILDIAFYLAI
jgi:hypothetical protein